MYRGVLEIAVRRKHDEIVADRELREERIDSPQLDTFAPADVSELGRSNVVLQMGSDHWEGRETLNDGVALLGAAKSLKQLLQDETSREDGLSTEEGIAQP